MILNWLVFRLSGEPQGNTSSTSEPFILAHAAQSLFISSETVILVKVIKKEISATLAHIVEGSIVTFRREVVIKKET